MPLSQAATSLFNAASSSNTEEQQAFEDALREAMSSPSQVRCGLPHAMHTRATIMYMSRLVSLTAPALRQTGRPLACQTSHSARKAGASKVVASIRCFGERGRASLWGAGAGALCVASDAYKGLVSFFVGGARLHGLAAAIVRALRRRSRFVRDECGAEVRLRECLRR